jgi:hypothetical protein
MITWCHRNPTTSTGEKCEALQGRLEGRAACREPRTQQVHVRRTRREGYQGMRRLGRRMWQRAERRRCATAPAAAAGLWYRSTPRAPGGRWSAGRVRCTRARGLRYCKAHRHSQLSRRERLKGQEPRTIRSEVSFRSNLQFCFKQLQKGFRLSEAVDDGAGKEMIWVPKI